MPTGAHEGVEAMSGGMGVLGLTFTFTVGEGLGSELYDVRLTTDGVETIARVRRAMLTQYYRPATFERTGISKRSPYDIHVPIIGFAVALGRAMEMLGDGDEETLSAAFRALARTCAELGV